MKSILRAKKWFLFTVIFYISQNIIFGWNATAQSTAEQICDYITHFGFLASLFNYFAPLKEMYYEKLKDRDKIDTLLNAFPERPEQGTE